MDYILRLIRAHVDNRGCPAASIQDWGKIAKPLLWSHANYIILTHAIEGNIPK
ncbi:MAG TPA: hypothetical protein G4N95_06770 [Anaerolineae bacterium]|nr:hypothetical protein [Anaerolineae bacterium]